MTTIKEKVWRKIAKRLPDDVRSFAKDLYYRDRLPTHPGMKGFGTVQDLYYWVADGNLDTLLVLQNYFSALFPLLDTGTEGEVSLFGKDGEALGKKPFSLVHRGGAKFRVSSLLEQLNVAPDVPFGSLEVHIAIPKKVLNRLQRQKPVYFWDRFYIGYVNALGQTCFVHGVDKTHIYKAGRSQQSDWYEVPKSYEWAPEIPVDIGSYQKFSVIMINRTSISSHVTLVLSDSEDNRLSWSADILPKGVHRFELTEDSCVGLSSTELRMRIKGMPTQFGRPVVFKEFANGAISAMHC